MYNIGPLTCNGKLKDKYGRLHMVPCCDWGPRKYPLPSECNYWIEQFKELRDHFTDEEIERINMELWVEAQSNVSILKPEDIIKSMEG